MNQFYCFIYELRNRQKIIKSNILKLIVKFLPYNLSLHLGLMRIYSQHRYILQTSVLLFSSSLSSLLSVLKIKHIFFIYILVFLYCIPAFSSISFSFYLSTTFPLSVFLCCLSLYILYFLSLFPSLSWSFVSAAFPVHFLSVASEFLC